MKSLHEKKVNMYHKIQKLMEANLGVLSANAAALCSRVENFNTKLSSLYSTYRKVSEKDLTYEIQKLTCLSDLRERAIVISGGLKAYSMNLKSTVLSEKAYLTKTLLDHTKDAELLENCEHLYDIANSNAVAIQPFGVTAIKLHAFKTSINRFRTFISNNNCNGSESSMAGKEADKLMQEIDNILESIDGIIDTQKEDLPNIHSQYYTLRGPYINHVIEIPKAVRSSQELNHFQEIFTNHQLIQQSKMMQSQVVN